MADPRRGGDQRRVVVVADWDSDGVVSAALVVFAQERLGAFPVQGERVRVELSPAGPRSLPEALEAAGCPDYLLILDIPATEEVLQALRDLRARGCKATIYYFDHHESTLKALGTLEEELGVKGIIGKSATSVLLRTFLEGLGAKLTPRLSEFTAAVAYLEGPRRRGGQQPREAMIKMAASISKALNATRSRDLWIQYVKWLSNPLPFEPPPKLPGGVDPGQLVDKGLEVSEESDARIKEAARDLAMSAMQVGYVKFVDARRKWKSRGASALAAEISRITGQPTVLLIERADGRLLLIIRGTRGIPAALADILLEMGIVEDKGGHENLATCRVKEGITPQQIVDAVRKASLKAWRKTKIL